MTAVLWASGAATCWKSSKEYEPSSSFPSWSPKALNVSSLSALSAPEEPLSAAVVQGAIGQKPLAPFGGTTSNDLKSADPDSALRSPPDGELPDEAEAPQSPAGVFAAAPPDAPARAPSPAPPTRVAVASCPRP